MDVVKSTEATFLLGKTVYKVLSTDDWKFDVKILKLLGLILVVGRAPSQTPDTVVTPEITIEFCDIDTTLEKVGTDNPGFEYDTIFPTVAIPTKYFVGSALVTVLTPTLEALILTRPISFKVD